MIRRRLFTKGSSGFGITEVLVISAVLAMIGAASTRLMVSRSKSQKLSFEKGSRDALLQRIMQDFQSSGYEILGVSSGLLNQALGGRTVNAFTVSCPQLADCIENPSSCANEQTCAYQKYNQTIITGDETTTYPFVISRDGSRCEGCDDPFYNVVGKYQAVDGDLSVWIELTPTPKTPPEYLKIDSRDFDLNVIFPDIASMEWTCPPGEMFESFTEDGRIVCENTIPLEHEESEYSDVVPGIEEQGNVVVVKPPDTTDLFTYQSSIVDILGDLTQATGARACQGEFSQFIGLDDKLTPICEKPLSTWVLNGQFFCIDCDVSELGLEECPTAPDTKICPQENTFCIMPIPTAEEQKPTVFVSLADYPINGEMIKVLDETKELPTGTSHDLVVCEEEEEGSGGSSGGGGGPSAPSSAEEKNSSGGGGSDCEPKSEKKITTYESMDDLYQTLNEAGEMNVPKAPVSGYRIMRCARSMR